MNPNSVDLSILQAFAGNYRQELFTALYNAFDAINDYTFWPGVKNTEKMTRLSVNGKAKPYTGDFNAINSDLKYTGLDLVVQPWQRDLRIKPSDFRNTFMAYNRGRGEASTNKKIPFDQFVWQTVFGQLAAGINNRSIYHGVGTAAFAAYNAGTVYTAGNKIAFTKLNGEVGYYRCNATTTAGQSPETTAAKWDDWSLEAIMVGYGAVIAALVTLGKAAGGLDPFVTGAIDASDDAYQIQKDLFRQLPIAAQQQGATIFQSHTDYWLLADKFEDRVSKYTETDNGITFLSGTDKKCVIKPVTSMAGTRRLIATPKSNMIIATDELSDFNTINIVQGVYHLDAGISGVIGVQIKDPEQMVVSDQS